MPDSHRSLAQTLKRGQGPFLEFGVGYGVLYVLDHLLRRLAPSSGIYPYEFFVQPISERSLLPPSLLRNIGAERLVPGHALLAHVPAPESEIAERFVRGAGCVAALRKGQPLGYAWWCRGEYPEKEVRCTFELVASEPAVFDFDVYVLPAHRMGLGFMAVWHVFMEQLRSAGVTHSYSRISRFNLASRSAHARLGAQVVGRAIFVRIGALTVALTGQFPYARAVLGDECRLRLRLSKQGVQW